MFFLLYNHRGLSACARPPVGAPRGTTRLASTNRQLYVIDSEAIDFPARNIQLVPYMLRALSSGLPLSTVINY